MSRRESMSISQEEYEQLQRRVRGEVPSNNPALRKIEYDKPARVTGANPKARMNRWELEYSLELEARKQAGEILWWGYEAIKLRLAGATYYTPDFCLLVGDSIACPIQCVEIKGFLRDDAAVKFKVAAQQFPCFQFLMLRKRPAKEGGGWELMKHLNGSGR